MANPFPPSRRLGPTHGSKVSRAARLRRLYSSGGRNIGSYTQPVSTGGQQATGLAPSGLSKIIGDLFGFTKK